MCSLSNTNRENEKLRKGDTIVNMSEIKNTQVGVVLGLTGELRQARVLPRLFSNNMAFQ